MVIPKRYRQLMGRYALLFVAGMALQLLWGDVDTSFLVYPWTVVIGINYLYILILIYAKSGSVGFFRRLYDRPAYLSSLASLLVLTLLFGLIRQDGTTDGCWGMLGFTRMTSSWIFVLFLVHFATVVGLKAVEDVHRWKQRKLPVVVMHVSFFVILVSAMLGSGEKVRVRVTTFEDVSISRGVTGDGKMFELPFTLTLKEFSLEGDSLRFHYLSRVVIAGEDGAEEVGIMVNHPARIGAWRIYQSGYDHVQGRWASILECVKDDMYPMIHVAMWMILVAGVWMMSGGWNLRCKRKEDKV